MLELLPLKEAKITVTPNTILCKEAQSRTVWSIIVGKAWMDKCAWAVSLLHDFRILHVR